jgi:hypothetical protein
MLRPIAYLACLLISGVLSLVTLEAHAALGQQRTALAGTVNPKPSAVARRLATSTPGTSASTLYSAHETDLDNSTQVREYATASGQVFAVTWQGPVLPNLQILLGGYFPAFQQETAKAQHSGRQRARVLLQTPTLVLQSSGRMGRFTGYAYAPDLIPAGVDIQTLLP